MSRQKGYFDEYKQEMLFADNGALAYLTSAPDKSYHLYIIEDAYPQGFVFKAKDPDTDLLPFFKEARDANELYCIGMQLFKDGVIISCQPYAPHFGLGTGGV